MKKVRVGILVCILLGACTPTVKKTGEGVVVTLKTPVPDGAKKLRLSVMSPHCIRVTATPEKNFSDRESLVVLSHSLPTVPFTVEETDSVVSVSTAGLTAKVNLFTGFVRFLDSQGKVLTSEVPQGTMFQPIEVDGKNGFSTQHRFLTTADEALYGLGQHQSDEWNYCGKNEDLYQYNTKVSLPFVISTRNYGIYWDAYSQCRYGDPREYAQLYKVFKLYNKEGQLGSLTATYSPSPEKSIPSLVRLEDSIYYENLKTIRNYPKPYAHRGALVQYEGCLQPRESGLFHFFLYYAGYVKVFLNDCEVVPERWRTAWNPNGYKFQVNMMADSLYKLHIEWQPDGGESYLGLRALSPRPEEEQNQLAMWCEMVPEADYYFMNGSSMDEVIGELRHLTGKANLMPKWAMGFWQSRERYKTQKELLETLREFRKRQIPVDNMILDWNYWPEDAWGSHEFDALRFPNPQMMMDSLHRQHAQLMISVWPKFYCTTNHYKEFDSRGWMYRQAVKDSIRDWVGRGYVGSFYDAYSKEARQLFWQQLKDHLYPYGIDAWWMDASEPNIRDCTDMPYRKQLCGPTALGPSTEYFNVYALMNANAIYSGLREADADKRVFQMTRSGFVGQQRYSTSTWSGDIATRWEDMKAQITAGLNFSLCGIPYWSMDIGGFCVEARYERAQRLFNKTGEENEDLREWRELNARWYQLGAMVPLYRSHGQYPYREPWNIAPEGHPAYETIIQAHRIRYALIPYLYSLAGKTYWQDYTLMRALAMDFPSDKKVYDISNQYLLGPSLMVCPVCTYGQRQREVYLPAGKRWYEGLSLSSPAVYEGGCTILAEAPLDGLHHLPLFVPAGAIIPIGPEVQYVDEKSADSLVIRIWSGADGTFELYEDDGRTFAYEQGACSVIPFSYREESRQLVIGNRQGSFPDMSPHRCFRIQYLSPEGTVKETEVHYTGKEIRTNLETI